MYYNKSCHKQLYSFFVGGTKLVTRVLIKNEIPIIYKLKCSDYFGLWLPFIPVQYKILFDYWIFFEPINLDSCLFSTATRKYKFMIGFSRNPSVIYWFVLVVIACAGGSIEIVDFCLFFNANRKQICLLSNTSRMVVRTYWFLNSIINLL